MSIQSSMVFPDFKTAIFENGNALQVCNAPQNGWFPCAAIRESIGWAVANRGMVGGPARGGQWTAEGNWAWQNPYLEIGTFHS